MWRPSLKLTNTAKFLSPGFLAGLDLQHLRQASVNICHVQVLAFGGVRWHAGTGNVSAARFSLCCFSRGAANKQ